MNWHNATTCKHEKQVPAPKLKRPNVRLRKSNYDPKISLERRGTRGGKGTRGRNTGRSAKTTRNVTIFIDEDDYFVDPSFGVQTNQNEEVGDEMVENEQHQRYQNEVFGQQSQVILDDDGVPDTQTQQTVLETQNV